MSWTASAEPRIIGRVIVQELIPATDVADHQDAYQAGFGVSEAGELTGFVTGLA